MIDAATSPKEKPTLRALLYDAQRELIRLFELAQIPPPVQFVESPSEPIQSTEKDLDSNTHGNPIWLAAMMQEWYCNTKYLDDHGQPCALPLTGRLSFKSLVTDARIESQYEEVLLAALANGLLVVSRDSRVKPVSRVVRGGLAERAMWAMRGVLSALRTTRNNIEKESSDDRWYHRAAVVSVPQDRIQALEALVRSLGDHFIVTIDDWCVRADREAPVDEPRIQLDLTLWWTPHGVETTTPNAGSSTAQRPVRV